jgi:hypothetical protein
LPGLRKIGERWESLLSQTQNMPAFAMVCGGPLGCCRRGSPGPPGPRTDSDFRFSPGKNEAGFSHSTVHSSQGAWGTGPRSDSDFRFSSGKNEAGRAHCPSAAAEGGPPGPPGPRRFVVIRHVLPISSKVGTPVLAARGGVVVDVIATQTSGDHNQAQTRISVFRQAKTKRDSRGCS